MENRPVKWQVQSQNEKKNMSKGRLYYFKQQLDWTYSTVFWLCLKRLSLKYDP
jgi:hypothetical protein